MESRRQTRIKNKVKMEGKVLFLVIIKILINLLQYSRIFIFLTAANHISSATVKITSR